MADLKDLKRRFINSLPEVPIALDLGLDEFVSLSEEKLSTYNLKDEDIEILSKVGLPIDAPPSLSFRNCGSLVENGALILGNNGFGDPICLDLLTGEVVCFMHDSNMERVFINSSLKLFLESLCIYQEHLRSGSLMNCLNSLSEIDIGVANKENYWAYEISRDVC
ncbi:SUKH-4 family immunity protein [Vibrio sp. Of7-15]|uniref:SUKH-4 family immunity protein n=1 Tax=Vibrio sp. Of7-15 TaxID=2724879 RepID=UPI001EF3D1C4|nr:SUKH-4 family immunity protein [Vibrio sp. Of7-15]MCG7500165.1 SUKH-4 family immunity protein [Vibrio sp. Of7-15]